MACPPEAVLGTPDCTRVARGGSDIAPTRGAPRLCTWKQASRILAGFPDDQAAGGHTAGPPSLAGLRKAKEQGWTPNGDSR